MNASRLKKEQAEPARHGVPGLRPGTRRRLQQGHGEDESDVHHHAYDTAVSQPRRWPRLGIRHRALGAVPVTFLIAVLAVPALAYDYPYNEAPITGSQLTDMPSQRSNVTMTGSFLRPETGYVVRGDDYWMRMRMRDAYENGYHDGYRDSSDYDDR